jgi:hypothetical protein
MKYQTLLLKIDNLILPVNQTYESNIIAIADYDSLVSLIEASQLGECKILQSYDGEVWGSFEIFPHLKDEPLAFEVEVKGRYIKLVYKNTGIDTDTIKIRLWGVNKW